MRSIPAREGGQGGKKEAYSAQLSKPEVHFRLQQKEDVSVAQSELLASELTEDVITFCGYFERIFEEARLSREADAMRDVLVLLGKFLKDPQDKRNIRYLSESIDVLLSAVSDPRGFQDMYIESVDYGEWCKLLSRARKQVGLFKKHLASQRKR